MLDVTTIRTQTELNVDRETGTRQFATVQKYYFKYTSKFNSSILKLIKVLTISESAKNTNVSQPKPLQQRLETVKRLNKENYGAAEAVRPSQTH